MRRQPRLQGLHLSWACVVSLLVGPIHWSACGAAVDDAQSAASGAAMTGTFLDSVVSGLDYRSSAGSGLTSIDGTFPYGAGDMVEFSIGALALGSAVGAPVLTPLDITAGAMDASEPSVTNKLVLLQTLDGDGDLNNGIQITSNIRGLVSKHASALSFEVDPAAFRASLEPVLSDLNAAKVFTGADSRPRTARTAQAAMEHFKRSTSERYVVRTSYGLLSGYSATADTWQFLGVPYAQPPVGELRWKRPQAPRSWTNVRDAIAWGDQAPQNPSYQAFGEGGMSEDCLYLNVTAPKNASQLPVMVWFHGGGFVILTGNTKTYNNPESLPTKGVVLVTVNHRLGPFGYLAHPLLSAEDSYKTSGNYGQLDLIAALEWVRGNISVFGGDPGNVTIFGESGGGGKVASLMGSPLARQLFHKAIAESGLAEASNKILNAPPLAEAEAAGESLLTRLGVSSLWDARKLPWTDIIQAELDHYPGGDYKDAYGPVVDAHYATATIQQSIMDGLPNDVPFMAGANSGDMPGLITGLQEQMPLRSIHSQAPQYVYKFSKVPDGWAASGVLSYHGGELTYVFNYPESLVSHFLLNLVLDPATGMRLEVPDLNGDGVSGSQGDKADVFASAGFSATDEAVADTVMSMWASFARTGDPSSNGVTWAPYTAEGDSYMEIAATLEQKTGLASAFSEVMAQAPAGAASQGAP